MYIIKIILIDNDELIRTGIRMMLEDTNDVQVIGEASTGMEGINLARDLDPQVVVLDFRLPDIDGLEVTQKMLCLKPNLKILILTSEINDSVLFRLLKKAKGYLTKDASIDEVIHAIKAINAEQCIISPDIAKRLTLNKISSNTSFHLLTDREMSVMMMVAHGLSSKEIAKKLHINDKSVHSYRSRIFNKLKVKNEVALTLLALRHNIISIDDI